MKIAIVGADKRKWRDNQYGEVRQAIIEIFLKHTKTKNLSDITLVSGHCHKGGVDIWAETIATTFEIKKEIYPAPAKQWVDKIIKEGVFSPDDPNRSPDVFTVCVGPIIERGYGSRNIQIAEACDILYDIEPAGSCTGRGGCSGTGYLEIPLEEMNEGDLAKECPKCEGDGSYSGGTWTLKHARKLGREVHKVIIE